MTRLPPPPLLLAFLLLLGAPACTPDRDAPPGEPSAGAPPTPEAAAGTGDQAPPGLRAARGNEPFWGVDIDGDEARIRTPEELDGTLYHSGRWERTGEGAWRFEAERVHADGVEYLTLEVVSGPCVDTMSGAEFPFSAVVGWAGLRMTGCAGTGQEGRGA